MARKMADGGMSEQPFISHLVELRDRLMRMVIAILAIFLVLFPFGNDIYVFIADPLMKVLPEGTSMIATQVASPFLTPFKLALVSAVFIAMPYILYQFWAFVAPGSTSTRSGLRCRCSRRASCCSTSVPRSPISSCSRWCSPS
jgi:Sec-independent protein secretion pathway component TatC